MILVEIYVAVLDQSYDFMLDENEKISQILAEIEEMLIKKMKSQNDKQTTSFMLCSMDRKEILSEDSTLFYCKIKNGSKLLLV